REPGTLAVCPKEGNCSEGPAKTAVSNRIKLRNLWPRWEFRLATPVPFSYTCFFHDRGCATVAQWQSTGFVNQMLWVQVPPVASPGTAFFNFRFFAFRFPGAFRRK